jgi:putative GTP pyrophosphokinase
MNKKNISEKFQQDEEAYKRLGQNIVDALIIFLEDNQIPFLSVYFRVKKLDSVLEKFERKGYSKSFDEIEDICGIRVICYYASDVEKVNKIIKKEFQIVEEENKSELLGLKEFAYRSQHYIVKINKDWNAAPNYRNLENFKAEIQVRTILMHAWAEIEHKLNYKTDAQVPDKFQRKLFRLSAKFEEADEQFEELKSGIEEYKLQLNNTILTSKKFNPKQDFNIDSFRSFVKFHFPEADTDSKQFSMAFEHISKLDNPFLALDDAIKKVKPHLKEIIIDLNKNGYTEPEYIEAEVFIWISLDIINDILYKLREKTLHEDWKTVVLKWKKHLS